MASYIYWKFYLNFLKPEWLLVLLKEKKLFMSTPANLSHGFLILQKSQNSAQQNFLFFLNVRILAAAEVIS